MPLGSPRHPKGTQGHPKGSQMDAKGSQMDPKGNQMGSKVAQGKPKAPQRHQKEAKGTRYTFTKFRSTAQAAVMLIYIFTYQSFLGLLLWLGPKVIQGKPKAPQRHQKEAKGTNYICTNSRSTAQAVVMLFPH